MRVHSQSGHKAEAINVVLKTQLPVSSRVSIGVGAIENIGNLLQQLEVGKRVLILSQKGVSDPWGARAEASIEDAGYVTHSMELPDGEASKSHEYLLKVWTKLQELQFTRQDTLVAVGGGALTDLAGFAASTYLRGIKTVLVPTTLLAQVDASIGGKTGINLPSGKNLAGTFHFPLGVVVDPAVLSTLPEREMRSGLGEIIKYAMIEQTVVANTEFRGGPRSLYSVLSEVIEKDGFSAAHPALEGIITSCIKMKLAVVGKDPLEGHLRRSLNLGHTLGHAIEKVSNYSYSHGEAVSIGCVFATQLSLSRGMFAAADLERLVALLEEAGLPVSIPTELSTDQLSEAMAFDKKRQAENIKFVLPHKTIGAVDLDVSISLDQLKETLKESL